VLDQAVQTARREFIQTTSRRDDPLPRLALDPPRLDDLKILTRRSVLVSRGLDTSIQSTIRIPRSAPVIKQYRPGT
jgi:hypothetical protein